MPIKELNNRQDISSDDKLNKLYTQFGELLKELRKRELSENIEKLINDAVDEINASTLAEPQFIKLVKQKQASILKQIEKELKIVPINYYQNLWMIFGFTSFGLPIGVAIGLSLGNIAYLGVGLPFGFIIGNAIGSSMDKKALAEGRQLNIEIKN
jgi:hypothetical protein